MNVLTWNTAGKVEIGEAGNKIFDFNKISDQSQLNFFLFFFPIYK